jgi:hypothetical protein
MTPGDGHAPDPWSGAETDAMTTLMAEGSMVRGNAGVRMMGEALPADA